MTRFLTLIAAILGTAAAAESVSAPLDTPSGRIEIVDQPDGFSRALRIGDRVFYDETESRYISLVERFGTLVLVQLSSGGNACASLYSWLHTGTGDLRATDLFGTCSDQPRVSADAETVTVEMASFADPGQTIAFVYDGRDITETPLGLSPSGSPPEGGALPWIGRAPYDLVTASDWRGPLVDLIGAGALGDLRHAIGLSSGMERDGNWVAGAGCRARMCDVSRAAIAIDVTDGRLLVAMWEAGSPPRLWGSAGGTVPAAILDVMSEAP